MILPPDFVLFDCDGVIVDSEPLTDRVISANLARHGLTLTPEEVGGLFLGGTIVKMQQVVRDLGARIPDDWADQVYAEIFEVLAAQVELVPGITNVLDALDAAGIGYAIGSNGPHRKMEITLGRTGLLPRFAGRIYSRQDVPNPKPAPDVYLRAAADAGIAPSRCVVIEDSENGARAGKAAGMWCLGFTARSDAQALARICDGVFDDMGALTKLLRL